jgi:hypothetical protein
MTPNGIPPAAWAIAQARASADHALLERLLAEGKVFRDPAVPQSVEQRQKRNIRSGGDEP